MASRKFDLLPGGKAGGGGPEDPMLEARVGRLEEKMDRIEGILVRLEPKVSEILASSAKQADLSKLQLEVAELKFSTARQADVDRMQLQLTEVIAAGAKQAELYKAQIEIAEVKGKVAGLPTTWVMIGTMITMLLAGFAIVNYQFAKQAVVVDRSSQGKTTPQ